MIPRVIGFRFKSGINGRSLATGSSARVNQTRNKSLNCHPFRSTFNCHPFWSTFKCHPSWNSWKGGSDLNLVPIQGTRCFHCSERKESPKLLLLFIRPFIAGLSGRVARWWWNRQPRRRREEIVMRVKRNSHKLLYSLAAYCVCVLTYWFSSRQKTPITGRPRFMAFTAENLRMISDMAMEQIVTGSRGKVLPQWDPRVERVVRVASRIVSANKTLPHLREGEMTVSVINEPGLVNAMVTSQCQIIVYADMVTLCSTDDELAMVLAHELSHAALDHVAEKISNAYLVGFFSAPIIAALWALLPSDFVAWIATIGMNKLIQLSIDLPYSRFIETEADDVGLQMAAKACFDVRTAPSFWLKVSQVEKAKFGLHPESDQLDQLEYFLTHPSSESRAAHLHQIMDDAIKIRSDNMCPPLREFSAIAGVNLAPPPVVFIPLKSM